jgi:hypothetical protein
MGSAGDVAATADQFGMAGAAMGATKLGSMLGGGGDKPEIPLIKFQTPDFVREINSMLEGYLKQAINTQKDYLGQATGSLNTNTQAAINAAKQYGNLGFAQSQALASPYSMAGSTAMDAYMDSLGLSRPKMGSGALAQAQYAYASAQPLLDQFRQTGNNPLTAPTAPTKGAVTVQPGNFKYISSKITKDQINNFIKAHTYSKPGEMDPRFKDPVTGWEGWYRMDGSKDRFGKDTLSDVMSRAKQAIATQQFNQLNQKYHNAIKANDKSYNTNLNAYNTQQSAYDKQVAERAQLLALFNQSGLNPQTAKLAQAYSQGMFTKPAGK